MALHYACAFEALLKGGVSEEDLTHNHVSETLAVGRYT